MGSCLRLKTIPSCILTRERMTDLLTIVQVYPPLDLAKILLEAGRFRPSARGAITTDTVNEMREFLSDCLKELPEAAEYRDVYPIEDEGLPYTLLAAGGETSGGSPSPRYTLFDIVGAFPPIVSRLRGWAADDAVRFSEILPGEEKGE